MRGENKLLALVSLRPVGSSPHARGKPLGGVRMPLGGGLIPACAGKTLMRLLSKVACGAHPRMRGENFDVGFTNPLC